MYGPNILDQYNTNYSMVGATPAQMTKYGYSVKTVPSMDEQIKKCFPLTGTERITCWSDADKYLMENVVPWVPYVWNNLDTITAKSVTRYEYDQFAGMISLCHIAVSNRATVS